MTTKIETSRNQVFVTVTGATAEQIATISAKYGAPSVCGPRAVWGVAVERTAQPMGRSGASRAPQLAAETADTRAAVKAFIKTI